MQIVATSGPNTEILAVEIFANTFADTAYAKDGWALQGNPILIEIHSGIIKEWQTWISPALRSKKGKTRAASCEIVPTKHKSYGCVSWAAL
jgi:hypothetical protein